MSHLAPELIAAFLDRTLSPDVRRQVEVHLVECEDCRLEVLEVQRIAGSVPGPRRWAAVPLLAAAAAALVLVVTQVGPPSTSPHREPTVQTSVAPATLTPAGQVPRLERLTWTSVVGAERYRVAVFDTAGQVLWDTTVSDTTVVVPASVADGLDAAGSYFWSVRARVAWDRWTESGLTGFRVSNPGAAP
ncbi:MAG TPA: zf-HC2 domain-containing protein [Gemmatimonadales bacterium]|nr:zf-HC2 domain-containing protein [Gemmatimonadales bacterium]